jgi:hypothetical protein
MKLFEELSEDVFELFAARHYYNPTCIDAEEFHSDVKRFRYLKRLINRYSNGKKVSENRKTVNLILNHLIVIFNVFGHDAGLKMLEFKINENNWGIIKPFLIFLNIVPNDRYAEVPMDKVIVEELRRIKSI